MITELLQRGGLSFERLQSFCLVAEAGGVTKAAKGDTTRQSLYSRQIRELEEFFGTELIRRKGRGIVLTPAGANLHVIIRENFASLSDFKKHCHEQPVEVTIGTGDSVIQWVLLPRLREIRQKIPLVRFKLLNLTSADAAKRLADGQIDFAIVRSEAIRRPLQKTPLGVMGYSLFVPAKFKPTMPQKNAVQILNNLPLATLEGEGNFRNELAESARKNNFNLNIQVECSSFPLAARAVTQGDVAAILPRIAAAEMEAGGAAQIPLKFLSVFDRQYCLASNPRLLRIRPALQNVAATIAKLCRF